MYAVALTGSALTLKRKNIDNCKVIFALIWQPK